MFTHARTPSPYSFLFSFQWPPYPSSTNVLFEWPLKWSAVNKAMLCWTKTFVTITSAFKTLLSRFESLLVKKLVTDDCFFEDSTLALCDSFLQWSVTSFRPWWLQDSFLQQGIQKNVTWKKGHLKHLEQGKIPPMFD